MPSIIPMLQGRQLMATIWLRPVARPFHPWIISKEVTLPLALQDQPFAASTTLSVLHSAVRSTFNMPYNLCRNTLNLSFKLGFFWLSHSKCLSKVYTGIISRAPYFLLMKVTLLQY